MQKNILKNNLEYGLKGACLGAATAGVGYAAIKNPTTVNNLAAKIGKFFTKKKFTKLPEGAIEKRIDPKIVDKLLKPSYLKKVKAAFIVRRHSIIWRSSSTFNS